MITPRERGVLRAAHRPDRHQPFGTWKFPSNGEIPSDKSMWQPRLGISWDPKADGKTVVRLNGGLFYGRVPGLALASLALDQRQPRAERLPRQLLQRLRRDAAGLSQPAAGRGRAGRARPPGRLRVQQGLPEPAHVVGVGVDRAGGGAGPGRARPVQLRQGRAPDALPGAERRGLRLPVGHRHQRDERHRLRHSGGAGLTSVESTAKSSYNGVTFGMTKRYAQQLPVPGELHDLLGQVRRRQRARPVHATATSRYEQPRRRVRLLGPRPAPPAERRCCSGSRPGR